MLLLLLFLEIFDVVQCTVRKGHHHFQNEIRWHDFFTWLTREAGRNTRLPLTDRNDLEGDWWGIFSKYKVERHVFESHVFWKCLCRIHHLFALTLLNLEQDLWVCYANCCWVSWLLRKLSGQCHWWTIPLGHRFWVLGCGLCLERDDSDFDSGSLRIPHRCVRTVSEGCCFVAQNRVDCWQRATVS